MKKAVIYLRVSTSRQVKRDVDPDGLSLPAQREACTRKAESLGAEVVGEFVDRGESARFADRDEVQKMLSAVKTARDIDYVIVHKLDRFARNTRDDANMTFEIMQAGATLVSVMENIDTTPPGRLMHGLMANLAEYYSANLATEVIKGMTQKAKIGGTVHRAPLGYVNVAQVIDGREIRSIAVDEDRAPLVQFAFERYSVGDISLVELADLLTTKGLTMRPDAWGKDRAITKSKLSAMLQNPYYYGSINHRGIIYDGRHKPLITLELFEKVQSVLKARLVGEKQRTHMHYLKGTVYCALCGSRLFIVCPKGKYTYFSCLRRRGCTMKYIEADRIERAILAYYRSVQFTADEANAVREEIMAQISQRRQRAYTDKQRLERKLQALNNEKNKLMQAYYANMMPLDLFGAEQSRIAKETGNLQFELSTSGSSLEILEDIMRISIELMQDCYKFYSLAPEPLRRQINQAFFEKVLVSENSAISEGQLAEPFRAVMQVKNLVVAKSKVAVFQESRNQFELVRNKAIFFGR
jgi:site-specific DNA recombinase